jgi:hypothetical protein
MKINERLLARYKELKEVGAKMRLMQDSSRKEYFYTHPADWAHWAISALNLVQLSLGEQSIHYQSLKNIYDNWQGSPAHSGAAQGIFIAAYTDYSKGMHKSLTTSVTGELFGDFLGLAKKCLAEGYKDSAAVIACAALEDCLKKYALRVKLDVDNKDMSTVISALKSKGLIKGAQSKLLDSFPKIRDWAMHANWDKITPESVGSVIGFVEQFIIIHY